MHRKYCSIVASILMFSIPMMAMAQQPVDIRKISVAATGLQAASGSNSVSCPTDTACTTSNGDPCGNATLTHTPFNVQSTGTTAIVVVPAVSAKNGFICHLAVITNNASGDTMSILDGTQMTNPCDNGTPTALMGSTTAANGVFIATQGIERGNGAYTFVKTSGVNRQICAIFVSSTRATLTGTYVTQ